MKPIHTEFERIDDMKLPDLEAYMLDLAAIDKKKTTPDQRDCYKWASLRARALQSILVRSEGGEE